MSDNFDPYYEWLGIPPDDRPLTYYKILGVAIFEDNPKVILNASDRQMAHLRKVQAGPHAKDSQRLLSEVATAARCLLDGKKKEAYDTKLRSLGLNRAKSEPEGEVESDGAILGEYLLIDHLGTSETGQVFKAKHRTLNRVVALKVLSSRAKDSSETVARFKRKVQLMARFDHPNLVAVHDAGERDGAHYLVMPYIEGDDLAVLQARFHPLPIPHVVAYLIQAADALGYAHQQGVFHRDVKPSNILVDQQGRIKVVGLGFARWESQTVEDLTSTGESLGTLDYMAPEQSSDSRDLDGRADVYALGCTLYHVLTGDVPFPTKSQVHKLLAHKSCPIPSLRDARTDASVSLDSVCNKMMAKRPEDRFQTMGDLIAALRAIKDDLVMADPGPKQSEPELDSFLRWVDHRNRR